MAQLLKQTTDPQAIVNTILDGNGRLKPEQLEAIYKQFAYRLLADNYEDTARLEKIAIFEHQFDGRLKTRDDLDSAISALALAGRLANNLYQCPGASRSRHSGAEKLAFFGAHLHRQDYGDFVIDWIEPGIPRQNNPVFRSGDLLLSVNDRSLKGLSKEDAEALEVASSGNQLKMVSLQDCQQVERTYMLQQSVPYQPGIELLPEKVLYMKFPTTISKRKGAAAIIKGLVSTQMKTNGGMAGIVL